MHQNSPNYASVYILDRLAIGTLASSSTNLTLVSNTYDAQPLTTIAGQREHDYVNYSAAFTTRGNVTQASSPGRITNTYYDITGTVLSQDDNHGHSVDVTTSAATNFTQPERLSPNGNVDLSTRARYDSLSFAPASVASPGQSLYDPSTASNGTAAYTQYDDYGRVSYTLAPSQVAGQPSGAQTNYQYGYGTPWTITATTNSHWVPVPKV